MSGIQQSGANSQNGALVQAMDMDVIRELIEECRNEWIEEDEETLAGV